MDERVENPELKEIMKTRPEEMTEEQLEAFVDAFMEATFIIPAELNSDVEALEGKTDEEIALDEEIDLEIMRLEDEDGNVLFPIYTDDDELEKLADEEDEDLKESSQYTNVFFNDDEKLAENSENFEEKISSEKSVKNIDSTVDLNEETEAGSQIIEASDDIQEVDSLLSKKEEKLIDEVIETVENNPRITLWSARSAAVLRYLRKTEPEFSISNEASNLIDAAIAEKYPEIWTLFNHL